MLRPMTQSLTSRKLFVSTLTIICLLTAALLVKGWQPGKEAAAHSAITPRATQTTALPAVDVKVEGAEFPESALIGEEFCYTALVNNVGGQVGFGPYLQLVLPPGIDLASVSLPGINSTGTSSSSVDTYPLSPAPTFVGTFSAPTFELTDPCSNQSVMGKDGGKLYIIKLPIGSLYANEPGIPVQICLKVDGNVAPDVPLEVCHNPVFQYTTATTGPAIPGAPNCQNVTPVVAVLYKLTNAPTSNHKPPLAPNETATGSCHQLAFELVVNVGDSKTITNLVISDTLPDEMVLLSSAAVIKASITGLTNPQVTVVGQTITVTGDSATGTLKPDGIHFNDRDVIIPFQAYIQNTDPNTCATKNVLNTAYLDAQYQYIDAQNIPHNIALMQQAGSSLIEAKHVALQKYARGPNWPTDLTVMPDDFVDYELHYQISQNITGFIGFRIEDTLPASMNFVPTSSTISYGSVVNMPINANAMSLGDGSTLLTFYPPPAALAACTKPIIRYKGQVPQNYNVINIPVLASDEIINKANVFYAILAGAKNCLDDTGAQVVVKPVKITKTIANDPIPPDGFKPGDVVKFRLKMEIPSGDTQSVTFTDFLPLPAFKVLTLSNAISQYSVNCVLGCGVATSITASSSDADNSIKFTLNPDVLSTSGTTPLVIELEFSIPVTSDPYADDLYLTNIFQSISSNTFGDEDLQLTGVAVHVRAPKMKITKGVALSDNGGVTNISPSPSITPINGNLINADGSDTITFAITVQNTGGAPAFDVEVTDTVPTLLVPDTSSIIVTGGPPVAMTPSFIGQQLKVKYSGSFLPAQTSVITFKAKLKSSVSPCQLITNKAEVIWASVADGTKFDPQSDIATVSIAKPLITKTILDPMPPYKLPIGGKVKYQVKIQIPESSLLSVSIVDMLGAGLAITNSSVVAVPDLSPNFSIVGSANGIISPTGDMLTFGFGLANFNSDNQPRFITINYDAVVLNVPSNQRGTKLNNTIKWTSPDCGTIIASAPEITVIEPTLKVTKTANPAIADKGDKVHFTINVMHDLNSDADAYDFLLADSFVNTSDMTIIPASLTCSPSGSTTCSASAIQVIAAWPKVALGQMMVVEFDATVNNSLKPCQDPVNQVFTNWTSLPGSPGKISPYNNLSFERTGNTSDPGGVENDYRANIQVPLTTPKPTITKMVVDTNASHTVTPNVALGEIVTYELKVCLPQGIIPSVKVLDQLPAGMQAVSANISSTGGIGGITAGQPLVPITLGLGALQTWNLGTLSVPVTAATGTVCFTIRFNTLVCDGSGLPPNQTMLTNGATVQLLEQNGQTVLCQASTQAEKLNIVEPKLELKKEFIPAFAKPGETVQIKLTLTNTGTADAFGISLQDTLNSCLTYVGSTQPTGFSTPNVAAGTVIFNAPTATIKPGAANALMFTISVKVGECCSLINTATVQATTMPGDVACERTETGTASANLIVAGKNCPCTPPPANLVSWWPFDETSGIVANDISGMVNNVGFYGPGSAKPTQTPGVVKNALCFDGMDDYVEAGLPTDEEINFKGTCTGGGSAESFTIDAWVRMSANTGNTGIQPLLDKRGGPEATPTGYHLFIINGRVGFQMNGVNYFDINSPSVADDSWKFIAVTVQRCVNPTGMIYVNGSLVHTFTPSGASLGNLDNSAKLQIGRREPGYSGGRFQGCLDELEFFKRALSSTELDNIFKAGSGGKCKTAPCPPGFGQPQTFIVNKRPLALAPGDFNNDGNTDLAVTNGSPGNLVVFKGKFGGILTPTPLFFTGTGPVPRDVVAGDFNGDGRLDLAVAATGLNRVVSFRNNSSGGGINFFLMPSYLTGIQPWHLTTGYFNNDPALDLGVVNFGSNNSRILLGVGTNTFSMQPPISTDTVSGSYGPVWVEAGNFNSLIDGSSDLLVANSTSNHVATMPGNGAGGLSLTGTYNFAKPVSLAAGDFDGDGLLDSAVVNNQSNDVSVLKGNGTGGFTISQTIPVGPLPTAIVTGDLNCDGILDLVVGHFNNLGNQNIAVLVGKGDATATFNPPVFFGAPMDVQDVALADMNNDGMLDIVTANTSPGVVAVMLNLCHCGCKPPSITVQPVSQKVCPNDTATFTAVAIGNPPMTMKWESFDGVNWVPISGATSNTYTTGDTTKLFRAVFTTPCGTATTDTVAVSIDPDCVYCPTCPIIQRIGSQGGTSQLTIQAPADVSWQFSTDRDWIIPTSDIEGKGNGSVDFLIPPNPLGVARAGAIYFAGKRYDVMQDAATTTRVVRAVAPTAPAVPGGVVTLPIEVIAQGNENSLNFSLSFDPNVLSNPQAVLGSGAGGATFDADDISLPGHLGVTLQLPEGQVLTAGTRQLLNVTFTVAANPGVAGTNVGFDDLPLTRLISDVSANVLPANFTGATITLGQGQSGSISGVVSYCIAPTKKVPGVVLSTGDLPPRTVITDNFGTYSLARLGQFTVTPAKTGDVNGITSLDAAVAARIAAGVIQSTPCQQSAGDANGNGSLSSLDAAQIARFAATGVAATGSALGNWKFTPTSRSYTAGTGSLTDQNYDAVLIGDVNGSWTPPSALSSSFGASALNRTLAPAVQVPVTLPNLTTTQGASLTIPVTLGGPLTVQDDIIAFDIELSFDPTVLQLQSTPIETVGTLSSVLTVTPNATTPGKLTVGAFGINAMVGTGTLLNLKFNVIGAPGSSTQLAWQKFNLNDDPQTNRPNGSVTIPSVCPTVTGINPVSGAVGSSVVITGTNFTGVTGVKFTNNLTATFAVNNAATQITATVPVGAATGPITISKTGCADVQTAAFTVTVVCPTLIITTATLPAGTVNTVYNQPLTQTGGTGTLAWSISNGALPPGLTLNAATGVLSNTPTTAGTFNFTVKVTDGNGCMGTRDYTLTINAGCGNVMIAVTPATLPAGTVNTAYSQPLTQTGGTGTLAWSISNGALPPGLTLNAATGVLSNTPTTAGTFNFTVKVTDGNGCMGTRAYTVTISGNVGLLANVSAASFRATAFASEEIVAAFGTGLATATQVATSLPLPTALAGTTVKVRDSAGVELLAPLFFVSPTQVNYLLPAGTATGAATVMITSSNGAVSAAVVQIASVAPGLFTASSSGRGVAAANALTFRPDGSSFMQAVSRFDVATSQIVAVPIDLGPPTDRVFLVLFGTGWRNRSALSAVTAKIGDVDAPVSYAGPQGSFAGLDQCNIEIPRSLAGRGLVDVTLTVDGQMANTVQINVR